MFTTLIIGIVIGLFYAYGGFFLSMYLDGKKNGFLSKFIGENDYVAIIVLLLWPLMVPFAYMIIIRKSKSGRHNAIA